MIGKDGSYEKLEIIKPSINIKNNKKKTMKLEFLTRYFQIVPYFIPKLENALW